MLRWPSGSTTRAASNGPSAPPCCPPDAIRATRDDSGWNTDDPTPTSATASRIMPKRGANAKSSRPESVNPIPTGSEYGVGRWSV